MRNLTTFSSGDCSILCKLQTASSLLHRTSTIEYTYTYIHLDLIIRKRVSLAKPQEAFWRDLK